MVSSACPEGTRRIEPFAPFKTFHTRRTVPIVSVVPDVPIVQPLANTAARSKRSSRSNSSYRIKGVQSSTFKVQGKTDGRSIRPSHSIPVHIQSFVTHLPASVTETFNQRFGFGLPGSCCRFRILPILRHSE